MPYVRTPIAALVENNASIGRPSCPPVDPRLGQLRQDATREPLALHVGYWDDPGWRHPDGVAGS
jgi:hypothetical protein